MLYADVIVDISHENIDKTYQYRVPEELSDKISYGTPVHISFGRGSRRIKGYVVGFSDTPFCEESRIKDIEGVVEGGLAIESQLISLAWWIKDNYGATMNDALRTVLPVKEAVKSKEKTWLSLAKDREETKAFLELSRKKNNKGRVRLLEALLEQEPLELSQVISVLGIARTTIKDMESLGYIVLDKERVYRNPLRTMEKETKKITLNEEQQAVADTGDYRVEKGRQGYLPYPWRYRQWKDRGLSGDYRGGTGGKKAGNYADTGNCPDLSDGAPLLPETGRPGIGTAFPDV